MRLYIAQILIRVVFLIIILGLILSYLLTSPSFEFLTRMWLWFLELKPIIVFFLTVVELMFRNDRDVIQGYSKVDNLVIVSIF